MDDAEWELLLHLFIVRAESEILCNARRREGSEKRSILQAAPSTEVSPVSCLIAQTIAMESRRLKIFISGLENPRYNVYKNDN